MIIHRDAHLAKRRTTDKTESAYRLGRHHERLHLIDRLLEHPHSHDDLVRLRQRLAVRDWRRSRPLRGTKR